MRTLWSRLLPAALLWGLARGAAALQPEDLAERWRWRVFDREEGLPAGSITAIGHDRDDYVYAGTERGLLRYDGFTWTRLETTEPLRGRVEEVIESGGDVYAATRDQVWVARYGLELHPVLKGRKVLLAAGPLSGAHAVDVTARTHHRLEKESSSTIEESPLPETEIHDYAIDERGLHWLATREGPYRRDTRTRFRWQLDPDLGPELRGLPCRRLFLVKRQPVGRAPVAAQMPLGPTTFELWAVFEARPEPPGARAGHLLARRTDSGWRMAAVDSSRPDIADLVLDGEGSYVAVTAEGRVFASADGSAWTAVAEPGVGSVALSGGLLDPHGYLWYRAGTTAIVRFDGLSHRWERYQRGLGLPLNNVLSLAEAADGAVWAGTEHGVFRFPPGLPGEPQAWRRVGDEDLRKVTGLAQDRTGKVWISSDSFPGAYFFHEGSWHRFEPRDRRAGVDRGIAAHPIRRIVADRGGDLWFLSTAPAPSGGAEEGKGGSGGHVIYRYSASAYTLSAFRALELPYGPANDLLQAQDKAYWIATDQGLVRTTAVSDELKLYTEAQGLRSSRIWAIAEGGDGSLWVVYDPGAASGFTRIRGDQVETFDERDGLASPKAWSAASTVSPEGSVVWFGTDRGIVRFDGECWYNHPIASLSPQESQVWALAVARGPGDEAALEGESILVGTLGRGIYRFRRDERRRPRITALESTRTPENSVVFHWDGRDFKNETPPGELRFRTRIDEEPWTPFTPARTRTVSGLEPGDHVFHVELRDLDGNPNRQKYAHRFHVPATTFLLSPLAWAALGGAGGALALAALAALLVARLGRARSPRRAPGAAGACAGFPGAALVLGRTGRIEEISGRSTEALGIARELAAELLGRPAELLPLFQPEPARRALRELLSGRPVVLEGAPIVPGEERRVDLRGFPLLAPARKGTAPAGAGGEPQAEGALVLVEETTAARGAQELRERARRLEALRHLAARIARELGTAEDDPRSADLRAVLRRFAGEEPGPREPLPLLEVLQGLLGRPRNGERPEAGAPVPAGVDLDLLGQTGLWTVRGDRREIAFAFEAVVRNGLEAMPGGGRLSVRLRNRRLEGDPGDLPAGPYVEVEVADSGAGISPAELGKVFDPFHSTKPRDRARGLGLSLAYGIIHRHRGDIRIASTPGQGTRVTLLLPADPGD